MAKVHDGVSGECVRRVAGKFRGIHVGLLGASLCVLLYLGLVSLERGEGIVPVLLPVATNLTLTVFGAFAVGLMWEISSKRALVGEVQSHSDELLRDVGLSVSLASQGILIATTKFHSGVPWEKYFLEADEIDVCWWAGFAWLQQHRSSIEAAVQRNGARFRYVIPDVRDCDVLAQMVAASGVREEEIKVENDKVMNMLRCLNVKVDLHRVKRVPRYGMVRLGSRVIFFPYSLLEGRPQDRPTFVLDGDTALGQTFLRDFNGLLDNAQKDDSAV